MFLSKITPEQLFTGSIHNGMTQKEVMVASVDLRELDAVPRQLHLLLKGVGLREKI